LSYFINLAFIIDVLYLLDIECNFWYIQELDAIIERAKTATIELRSEEDSEDEGEMSMYCITCGHEIHSRMAIKHMEKCFNKVF
jgi:hypothetical protein